MLDIILAFFVIILALRVSKMALILSGKTRAPLNELTAFPDITVMMPTFNDSATIVDTLNSINAQTYKGQLNVVVIDDGSTDGATDIIKNWIETTPLRFKFQHARNYVNTGRKSLAINAHLSKIEGRYIVLLDGDGIIDKDSIAILAREIENAKPNTVMVSGRTLVYARPGFANEIQDIEYYHRYYVDFESQSALDATFWCSGALSIISASDFLIAGGCDPNVLCEDTVMSCHQLFVKDKITKYCGDAVVFTEAQPTIKQLYKQRKRWLMAGLEAMDTGNFKLWNKRLGLNVAAWSYVIEHLVLLPVWLALLIASVATLNVAGIIALLLSTSAVQLLYVGMMEWLREGKPFSADGPIDNKHSLAKKLLYCIPMQMLNSAAMIHAIFIHVTGQPKVWNTR